MVIIQEMSGKLLSVATVLTKAMAEAGISKAKYDYIQRKIAHTKKLAIPYKHYLITRW